MHDTQHWSRERLPLPDGGSKNSVSPMLNESSRAPFEKKTRRKTAEILFRQTIYTPSMGNDRSRKKTHWAHSIFNKPITSLEQKRELRTKVVKTMQTKNLISLQVVLNFITCMKSTLLPDPVALQGASPNGESWIDAKCCENFFFWIWEENDSRVYAQ